MTHTQEELVKRLRAFSLAHGGEPAIDKIADDLERLACHPAIEAEELVKRLRKRMRDGWGSAGPDPDCQEAADLIERLTAPTQWEEEIARRAETLADFFLAEVGFDSERGLYLLPADKQDTTPDKYLAKLITRAILALHGPFGVRAEEIPVGKTEKGRFWKIGKFIEYLTEIKSHYGDTCVYIRPKGASWGATALNWHAEDAALPAAPTADAKGTGE